MILDCSSQSSGDLILGMTRALTYPLASAAENNAENAAARGY